MSPKSKHSPIQKLIIRSFKSIADQEIELGLINIFIGSNGSGKSNILEALGVLSAAGSGYVDDESLLRRGVRPGIPRLYKSAFKDLRTAPHIFFDAQTQQAAYAVSLNNPLENPSPYWQYKTENLLSGETSVASRGTNMGQQARNKDKGLAALKSVELDPSDPAAQLLETLSKYAIYSPNTPTLRGMLTDPQTRDPLGLSGGRLAEAVRELKQLAQKQEFLASALDEILSLIDWVNSLETSTYAESFLSASIPRPTLVLKFEDRFMNPSKNKNILTAYDASEGALYVLFAALLALMPQSPPCFAIDNLDQALNPRLIQRLVEYLCKWTIENPVSRQMLLTLHNPAALDGLPLLDDRVRLFAVDRNNKGYTCIKRVQVTPELVQLSEKKGWPLSRLWVMGHLGGVPNV